MESALLRCNTLTRQPLPLCIPSPFHAAANLQFSIFRHSSLSSRSNPKRQTLRPITSSAVGGFRFRTPSRQKNKGNIDHKVAKRVERSSLALACAIGIISYSFWLRQQQVLAAPEVLVGKCSSQMESVARQGGSRKPCPATKANPHCKCRRITVQTGSEPNRNENLQKLSSEVAGAKLENLQKPNSEVPGDTPDDLQKPKSEVSGDMQENLQKPNSEVPGDKQENLQKPNSEVPGDKQENLQKPNSEVPGDKQENLQKPNSEVPGDEQENLQKPNSEVAAPAPQVLDKSEDSSQSKSVPQQTPSPPHGGELGSFLTAFSIGGLISEAEKHVKPELQVIAASDVKEDDHSSQSPLLPQQLSSTNSPKSLLSPDMAEKHLKSESQEKTSDVKAEELPQSPLLPQQSPPTVCQKTSLSADMAEKYLKSESQERKQPPSTVGQESLLPQDTAEKYLKMEGQEELQGKNRHVKGNSTTTASHSSPSLPSPLVSITFKVDSSAMPSLAFVSPSTITPAEARPVEKLKSDRDDGAKVLVRGLPVSSSAASVAEQIFADHGDVTANCLLKDQAFRANLVEGLVTVMQILQEFPARKLSNDDLILIQRKVEDLEKVNVDVGWLRERIEAVGPFLDVVESTKKWEAVAAEVGKLRVKLAEQEAKLAQHEVALAKKFAEKEEVEIDQKELVKKFAEKEEAEIHQEELVKKFAEKEEVEIQKEEVEIHQEELVKKFAEKEEVEIQKEEVEIHQEELVKKFAEKAEVESEGSTDDQLRKEEDVSVLAYDLGALLIAGGFTALFCVFLIP